MGAPIGRQLALYRVSRREAEILSGIGAATGWTQESDEMKRGLSRYHQSIDITPSRHQALQRRYRAIGFRSGRISPSFQAMDPSHNMPCSGFQIRISELNADLARSLAIDKLWGPNGGKFMTTLLITNLEQLPQKTEMLYAAPSVSPDQNDILQPSSGMAFPSVSVRLTPFTNVSPTFLRVTSN